MHRVLRTLRTQWLGALGILVGITGVAFGATGDTAILGKLNQANKPTIIENTGNGPAVTFKTKATKPPFAVTSGKQVPNLNASKLAGKPVSAFALAGSSYSKAESDAKYIDTVEIGGYYTVAQADGTFAPAVGSPNYAPATGSPNYAPATGSASYAPATGSANYAPASGSTNYLPTGYRTLATFGTGNPENTNTSIQLFPPREFTAPADGTIFISMTGICFGSASNTIGTITVQAEIGPDTDTTIGTPHILCDLTDSVPVSAADVVEVRADMSASNGTVQIEDFSGTVYFVPN